jgi:uracil-DNA glycosylase
VASPESRDLGKLQDGPDLDWLLNEQGVSPTWSEALAPVAGEIRRLMEILYPGPTEAPTLPSRDNALRAFHSDFSRIRVVIVGQDPYPTPGDAVGLSFSVAPHSRVPRSLTNIFAELRDDLGLATPANGDLSAWAQQGVLLLNRVLTVPAGQAGGHRRLGWEGVTDAALRALAARPQPPVVILWGNDAAKLLPLIHDDSLAILSPHPSPLSARRGFFGSKPFSRVNKILLSRGEEPIDWTLPPARGAEAGGTLF